ncbi:Uma2 family endonuclease [Actinomadura welshii]|uniref:Uma2 family endonuclease n=1 Tax=Actinomadura welshii TaxID=3103817 RepID=UPI0003AD287B|nr:Uma2 family endonuclease [Actinomadura madurae]
MTVMVHEPLSHGDADVLLEGFLALDTPEGFRAELIDGEIVVSPPPIGAHEWCIAEVGLQVVRDSPHRFHWSGNKGLLVPSSNGGQLGNHVIPDATFALAETGLFRDAESWMPVEAGGVAMVVEVTSSRPEVDRDAKRRGYARAEIPLYLLVDRREQKVSLFSEPKDGDYHKVEWVPFGKSLPLPEPIDIELDTSGFA